jgi:hypothetical protein
MMIRNYFLSMVVIIIVNFEGYSQSEEEKYNPLEVHLQFKSNYFWRGLTISDVPFILTSANFVNKEGNFKVGIRGSNSFNGTYKQFDYFLSYKHKNLRFIVFDIFNYSTYLAPKNDLFDYNASTTRHFIDATIGYTISKKFPLDISWSTIVFGRDRDALVGDVVIPDHDPVRNGKNRYSTYVQLSYPYQVKDIKLDFFVGGVFTLNGQEKTFFSDKAGIATIGFNATKQLKIGDYSIPVMVSPTWNTLKNSGGVVLTANLF